MAPARILIAEDERSIRTLLRTCLVAEGYTVDEATNGQEVMDALTQDAPPDLIILDLSIPAPHGMEVLHRLKNMVVRPRPRVIVLTANGSVPTAVEAVQHGAANFLEKPCEPALLLGAIQHALDQKVLAEAATSEGCAAALARARRCLADGQITKAESYLRTASRISHHDPEFHYLMGLWNQLSGRIKESKAAYQLAAEHHSEAREALLKLCSSATNDA